MNQQPTLFERLPYEGQATAGPEHRRMGRQCRAILELLRAAGSVGVTNRELSEISLKYTGRISDLRKRGYRIECDQDRRPNGLATYRLLAEIPAGA